MNRKWLQRGLTFGLLAVVAVALSGLVVMSLWNWLTPALFGWKPISFLQALGLLLLSRLLLGRLGGRPGRRTYWRQRMRERWEKMTPEERERFRAGLHGRCGRYDPPTATPPG